ncbi:MAG: O-antigen ligase family protein [Sulfurimonas sp.]|nr:O-antigen ligase family protein [Sulfurimonas sp.]
MATLNKKINIKAIADIDSHTLINYLLICYALVLPISKAGVNFFETLILLTWFFQGDWKSKYEQYIKNLLIVSIILFIAFHFISIPFASSTSFAIDYILKYKHLLIILPIYSSLDEKYIRHIFSAFLFGIFLSEIMSYGIFFELWQYKNISPHDPSPFMSHVDYSVFLSFASIILLSRIFDHHKIDNRLQLVYIFFFITATSNLFINGGRTGQVTFIVMIFISVILNLEHKLKGLFVSLLLLTSIFTTAYMVSPNFHSRANQGLQDIQKIIYENDYSDSIGQRVSLWVVGADNFKDNFFLGKGIGNDVNDIKYYAQKNGFDSEFLSNFGDNHNMFLIVALKLGITGLLILLAIFYSIFKLHFTSKTYKILNLTFIVAFFLWSFGNTTLHTMNAMTFFALFAGMFNKISTIETMRIK